MTGPLRSADVLVKSVLDDPAQKAMLATNPGEVLHAAAAKAKDQVPAYFNDVWVYRIVVGALCLVVLTVVGAYIYLATGNAKPNEALVAIGSGALGAITGLLAPSPGQKG
jgi:cytochrome bd-type quinol oxidase subunit 1